MVARLRLPFRSLTTRATADAMTLGEHLAELRRRVVISILALTVGATVACIKYPQI